MLNASKVPRSLETKARLFGFELGDLLLVFLYLSISNLIFGSTSLKFLFVWVGTSALALFLFFVKRGKPDNYLQHYGEYLRNADILTAAAPDLEYVPFDPLRPRTLPTPEIEIAKEIYEKEATPIARSG